MSIDTGILEDFTRFINKTAMLGSTPPAIAGQATPPATIDAANPMSGQLEQRVNQTGAMNQQQQPNMISANSAKPPTSNAPFKKIKF